MARTRRTILHTLGGLLLVLFAASGTAPAATSEVVLTILHTNDMHGRALATEPMTDEGPGGLARIATMAKTIKAANPVSIFLDAGDAVQGTPTEFMNFGTTMIRAMNAAGYDGITLGNHEFDWSATRTADLVRLCNFPAFAANVRSTATGGVWLPARESFIYTRGPLKIAVFGLATPGTVPLQWPPTIKGLRFEDPIATAKRIVPELRSKADVVICLSHLGYTDDRVLAASVSGIDFIIGGHSHTILNDRLKIGTAYIAHAGSYSRHLGRIDAKFRQTTSGWALDSVNGANGLWWTGAGYPGTALIPVTEEQPSDSLVRNSYSDAWNRTQTMLSEVIGEAPRAIPGEGGATNPKPVQVLLADLLREAVYADVGVIDGAWGTDLPAGIVTSKTIYEMVTGYTRQNVVVVRAKGSDIRKAVERIYGSDKFRYFGGIYGSIARTAQGVQWRDARIGRLALNESKEYRLAAPSYLIMDTPEFANCPVISDRVGWVKPLIIDAIRKRRVLTVPDDVMLPSKPAPIQKPSAATGLQVMP